MEKRILSNTKSLTKAGIFCALSVCTPLIGNTLQAEETILEKELNRRVADTKLAQQLLLSGDKAYKQADYETAVKDYSEAFQLLPNGYRNLELRNAAAERYASAATERSRRLMKFGHYDEARNLLKDVLKPNIAPNHLGALKLSQQIDDPIRYNPALSKEHVADVVKVGQLLREGEGFHSLGQYDRASESYQDVLRLDPFNKAARRGMERINSTQADYYRAARDQTRSAMLGEVDANWELSTLSSDVLLPEATPISTGSLSPTTQEKLSGIIIEKVYLDQVNIDEAIDFLRIQSRLNDTPNLAGEQDGINIFLNLGTADESVANAVKSSKISIQANNLPLSIILDYIAEQTSTQWKNDGVAIQFTPLGSANAELSSKTFRVPPDFLSSTQTNDSDDADNIFLESNNSLEGKLAQRISAKDYLKQMGVTFPEGASAKYIAGTNSLIVRNTAQNIELISQIVSLATGAEPVQVVTRATIIRISETDLKELGFDWLLSPVDIGSALLGGGSIGNGSPLEALSNTASDSAPVTSGLRSGSQNQITSALDTFLAAENSGFGSSSTRAPGILSLTHTIGPAQLQVIMRGLDQSKGADIMVQPSVISRSGERASVKSIREIIYPTEYEPPEIPDTSSANRRIIITDILGNQSIVTPPTDTVVTPSHPTAFETRNVGVSLEVEATVDENKNYVSLSLLPELVEFEGFVNYGTPINGASNTRLNIDLFTGFFNQSGNIGEITPNDILMPVFKTITTGNIGVTVQDGATVVLGGLINSSKTKTEDKLPILGDLPIAGRLFRNEASSTFNEAIIIMVNTEIIDPTGHRWKNR